jgi:L-rhamnose isomerase
MLPLGAIWDHYCRSVDVPAGAEWLEKVRQYEKSTLAQRTDESVSV